MKISGDEIKKAVIVWIPSQTTGPYECETVVSWRINIRHTHKIKT